MNVDSMLIMFINFVGLMYSYSCFTADIEQILLEAQNRWLRPAEICEILRNYNKFRISPEPAHRPPSMTISASNKASVNYYLTSLILWMIDLPSCFLCNMLVCYVMFSCFVLCIDHFLLTQTCTPTLALIKICE